MRPGPEKTTNTPKMPNSKLLRRNQVVKQRPRQHESQHTRRHFCSPEIPDLSVEVPARLTLRGSYAH